MRNGTNERIYIGIGFKLTNSMSFDESQFSTGLFQKATKRDLFVKGKFRIKIRHIRKKTLEDTRTKREVRGYQVGLAGPTCRPPDPSRGFLHELLEYSSTALLGCISVVPQVSLI
jgi:hypothetical protein